MTFPYKHCVLLCLLGSILSWSIHAQDIPPVIIVIDASSSEIAQAVDFVVPFIAAHNPVSLVTTCSPVAGTQTPNQDAAALRALIAALPVCESFDHAQALQNAVTQIGDSSGDLLYLIDGRHLTTGSSTTSSESMKAALAQVRERSICLYVIPIGDASLPSSAPGAIDRDQLQDLINRVTCGTRYTPQRAPTLANTILQAYLASQGRTLMMRTGEQLSLFERSTARLKQAVPIADDVESVRIDVVWGNGDVQVALQPPTGASVEPEIISGAGFQSLALSDPAPGVWNVVLSSVDVPDNQVGVVLFSQGEERPVSAVIAQTAEPSVEVPSPTTASEIAAVEAIEVTLQPMTATDIAAITPPATRVTASAATVVETAEITAETLQGITAAEATEAISPSAAPHEPIPPSNPDSSLLLPVGAGLGALILLAGLWMVLLRPSRRPSIPAADPSLNNTFHSKTTSEMPPVELSSLGVQQAVQPASPLSDTQFRQFPAVLVFLNGPQRGQFIDIDSSYFTIGRHSSSRLRIQDVTISREHARIIFDNAQNLYRIDNLSKAGTQVNGRSMTSSQPLYNGDLIQIGTIQIQFQLRLTTSL